MIMPISINAQDYGISDEMIDAYPEPNVIPLIIDESLLYNQTYRKMVSELTIYETPNGNITKNLGNGFSFVTVNEFAGDWTKINENEWIRTASTSEDVLISRFTGVKLPDEELPYTMAWILRHLRPSLAPGQEEFPNNPFLYRYTRVNIYDEVDIDGKIWYQIGKNQWVHQYNVAKILPVERPEDVDTYKWIGIDLYEQVAIAYEDDQPVFATLVSSGLNAWPTNEGLFHVYLRYPKTVMSGAYQREDFYYLEDVPWTMYFDDEIALHGTYWHDGFGFRQSHGCVNISITDSHWFYEWAADEFDFSINDSIGPAVYVFSSGVYD